MLQACCMIDRRLRRSEKMHEAMTRWLEVLRLKRGLSAVALASEQGFIAGSGDVDLEWMGALGASRRCNELEWNEHTLFVQPVELEQLTLYLVATEARINDEAALQGIRRILE